MKQGIDSNLFIVGVPKAATTSLCDMLNQHPEIFVPAVKEPMLLATNMDGKLTGFEEGVAYSRGPWEKFIPINSRHQYNALYEKGRYARYRVDGSTMYFNSLIAPHQIISYSQNPRIVVQLREPLSRAWSAYTYARSKGEETKAFREALEEEMNGYRDKRAYGGYLKQGCYGKMLETYLQYFPREHIHITYFEDFKSDAASVISGIFDFLQVGRPFPKTLEIHGNPTLVTPQPLLRTVRHFGRRIRHTKIGQSAMAKSVHNYILAKSTRPDWICTDNDREIFNGYLAEKTDNFIKEKKLGITRYV